jgi:hypothetical protein
MYCLAEHSTVPSDTRQVALLAFAKPHYARLRLTDEVKAEHLVEEHEKSLVCGHLKGRG